MMKVFATLALFALLQAEPSPRFSIAPEAVLMDERFRVALDGVKPGQDVTIRVDGNRGQWQSSAVVRSDALGRVEIADPLTLIWSATGDRPPPGTPVTMAQPWTFTAEVAGRAVATQTIVRRAVAENVRVVPVRERGLVATAYFPPGNGRRPAMIVLPGSQGGLPGPGSHAGGLASRGYVVLALAYFNAEGLPPLLQNIPLEYFARAAEWLRSQPSVDAGRIGVLGTSRGGELALLLGATFPSLFRVVVANVPSSVVWPGLSDDSETPAWTLNGKPLISVPSHFSAADRALPGRERFLKRLQDKAAVARAEIPVERIAAPLLMFSGKDDQLWPSDIFAARVVERLQAHKFRHAVEHYSYDDAGHQIQRPFTPTSDVRRVRIHPVSKRPNISGGTPEGQARANEDAWARLLAFLEKHLRSSSSAAPASNTLRVWTARAIATVLAEVGSEFEKASGYTLSVTSDLPAAFERRVTAGERVDVLITGSVVLDEWIARGRILADTRADIARSGIGVGVRAGAVKPDISSADAFKRALLDAKSIAYLRVGSGLHVDKVIAQLGIADAITPKVTRPESDIVSELVAKGEIELGIVVITQILTTPGVALAGPLPPGLQAQHTFTAGVSVNSGATEPARALIRFLHGPSARRVIQHQGMEAAGAGAGR